MKWNILRCNQDKGKGVINLKNKDYLEAFEDYMTEKGRSKHTIINYVSDLNKFFDFIGKDIKKVTKKDIQKYVRYLEDEKELKVTSINRKIVSVKQFIDFINDSFQVGVMVKIEQVKEQEQRYLENLLTKEDYEAMVKAAIVNNDLRAKAIFETLYYTGVRVSELLQLTVDDVTNKDIRIKGKGNKRRKMFVISKVRDTWDAYLGQRLKTSAKALFTGQRGPINTRTVNSIIGKYAEMAKVEKEKAHAHNFRHLCALRLVKEGVPIKAVQDILGHSNMNTTGIYLQHTKDELLEFMERM